MKGSARENWVKAFLPAAIVILVYALLIHLNQQREIKALHEQLSDAQRSLITEDDLLIARQTIKATRTALDTAQRAHQDAQEQLDRELTAFRSSPDPLFMLQLDQVCHELSLSLISHQVVGEVPLADQRKAAIRELKELIGKSPEYRCLHVSGSYRAVMQLLERLPREIPRYMPLAVELLALPSSSMEGQQSLERQWKIFFLM